MYKSRREICTSFKIRKLHRRIHTHPHGSRPESENTMSSFFHGLTRRLLLRKLLTLGIIFSFSLALVVSGSPLPAKAANSTPQSHWVFNDPSGSKSEEYVIANTVIKVLDGAPRGATAKLAFYQFDLPTVADAVIRADARGVTVKFVTDRRHAHTAAIKAIQKAFKKNKRSTGSVKYRTTTKQIMHVKIVLVSKSGKAKNIAMWGSSNMSKSNTERNNNDFRMRVNPSTYGCLSTFFDELYDLKKYKKIAQGQICKSKGLFMQFTPAAGKSLWTSQGIDLIKCVAGTKVYASSMQWSDVAVARAFVGLQEAGCDVRLLVSGSYKRTLKKIFVALKKPTKHHGKVKVFTPKPGHGIHYKFIVAQGPGQAWVATGSLHPSKGSQHGVQLFVREGNKAMAKSYLKQFEKLTAPSRAKQRS